ncbi:MAG: DNA-directed RNA polymerase subunit beta', partial [Chloroflexota bacterium]|nr:DNA-directed RNA polymerase subunit beta' [Chloroflexota bacterium]
MELQDFEALRIGLASPEEIRSWSYGEVTKPETINYRRLRPEKDGLFCEAIFGPTKDYQCYCGKYKGIRYEGVTCEKCGVEVTRSSVRRERMGHIELATPIAHIWYTRRLPSHLGRLLGISRRELDRVLYYAKYIVIQVDEEARQRALSRLDEESEARRKSIIEELEERIASLTQRMESEIAKLEETRDVEHERLEQELNAQTEKVMDEAQRLQTELLSAQAGEHLRGRKAERDLVFHPQDADGTETKIVSAGEMVDRDSLTRLNEMAQKHLSVIEEAIRRQQEKNAQLVEEEIEQLRHSLEEQTSSLREQAEQQIDQIAAQIEEDRETVEEIHQCQCLNEAQYRELKSEWGNIFQAGMGAEALYEIVKDIDLEEMAHELWREIRTTGSKQRRKRAARRLRVVEALRKSGNQPEWMFLTVLPVIPPDLRPMVQLDGGRFATSDLNDLYRRVINRNNRLKRLLELEAPDVIVRNEKRMLQEAVDSLLDNSRRGKATSRRGNRELKSLSDMLKGKTGRFRRNLLGKRVDYSGRSVIVVGPKLKMHQCGLPREMALELYKPFVISKLVEYNYANNVKGAKRVLERGEPEVWKVLEEAVDERPVLLNRAPTLHRLSIQAFEPVLVEGKAIQIHPLVCAAFNADFDGDQMAVHVPLSQRAVEEARKLMLASRNLLKPANGVPLVGPSKDMVLGCYYMTMEETGPHKGEDKVFSSLDEVQYAHDVGIVDLHAKIKVYSEQPVAPPLRQGRASRGGEWDGKPAPSQGGIIETTVGRVLFNQILPPELRFINEVLDKGKLQDLVARCYKLFGDEGTAEVADKIKDVGFEYATRSGISLSVFDLAMPKEKEDILEKASQQVDELEKQYRRGLLTENEQYVKVVETWTQAKDQVTDAVARTLDPTGPIAIMADSGATKQGMGPITQLAGMRGLMADASGRIIPMPIRSSFREGLTALEYFLSSHGSRKGLADTALRTADAGYLTRRLVDVAQGVIVNAQDCGTRKGIWVRAGDEVGGQTMGERITGRVAAEPVVDPSTGEIIVERNEMITEEFAARCERLGIEEVYIRSPMTCELRHGVCAKCYGRDLARGGMVKVGTPVGVIAAQSIGEPGTQLTLRTFHTGGVATETDITHGLPRAEELLEARKHPKGEAIVSEIDGVARVRREEDGLVVRVLDSEMLHDVYEVPEGGQVLVDDGQMIESGTPVISYDQTEIVADHDGKAFLDQEARSLMVSYERRQEREYEVPSTALLLVGDGDHVTAGQQLTEGVKNPRHILNILGREATQRYLLSELQNVYRSQGVDINDKHFEIVIRQMLSKVEVTASGDSDLLPGELVNRLDFALTNERLAREGKEQARAREVLLGISKAALNTDSFLSAASFQYTIRILSSAAAEGKVDELNGLKENVILGKLIPAGTGFRKRPPVPEEQAKARP